MAEQETAAASSRGVKFESEPLSWATGSEVRGIDLTRPQSLTDANVDALMNLLAERGILLFRGQKISHAQHIEFTRRFGPLAKTGLLTRYAPAGYPDLFTVTNMKVDGVRSETWNAARQWHSDQSFLPVPARACLLRCELAPKLGGNTLFANMYQAYNGLSDGLKKTLDGMYAHNTSTKAEVSKTREDRLKEAGVELKPLLGRHPVVRTHPETEKKAPFVNCAHTSHFEGWTEAESTPLLQYLYAHQVKPEFTVRFRWEVGSIAFWDNRCAQHNPINDYHGYLRVMHRVTLEGDVPA